MYLYYIYGTHISVIYITDIKDMYMYVFGIYSL